MSLEPGSLAVIVNTGDDDFDGLIVEVVSYAGSVDGDSDDPIRAATVSDAFMVRFPEPIQGALMAGVNRRYLRPLGKPGERVRHEHAKEIEA